MRERIAVAEWVKRRTPFALSVVLHGALLLPFVWHAFPALVQPVSLMKGDSGRSLALLYAPAPNARGLRVEARSSERSLLPAKPKKMKVNKPAPRPLAPTAEYAQSIAANAAHAGSKSGSTLEGLLAGREIRPALPLVFPDPPIPSSQVPADVAGDVVVEVTIDARGNVVKTRLLQGLGHGIEEKVIATVLQWRFRPATADGVPIASLQDVVFHYPV